MTDKNFPDRPDHPDFWLISQALIDTDAQADSGQSIPDIAGRIVNTQSLVYAATQRAMRGLVALHGRMTVAEADDNKTTLAALWMDAFVAGTRYQHLKARGAQTAPDSPASDNPAPASGELLTIDWDASAHTYAVHVRADGNDDWQLFEGREDEIDTLMSLARDVMTGG
jgi:hypothetical protein